MATQQPNNEKPAAASPTQIGEVSVQVAQLLAKFTSSEQGRIIRAAATINGLEPMGAKKQ